MEKRTTALVKWLALAAVGLAAGLFASMTTSKNTPRATQPVASPPAATSARAAARHQVPRLAAQRSALSGLPSEGVVTDPRSPGYDATQVANKVGTAGVYELEPRNPAWAEPVERGLAKHIALDIPGAEQVSVECHTTTCRATWSWSKDAPGSPDERQRWTQTLAGELYSPMRYSQPDSNVIYMMYAGDRGYGGDGNAIASYLGDRRRHVAAALKNGSFPQQLLTQAPRIYWPKEE
jgi:hypothetical protein